MLKKCLEPKFNDLPRVFRRLHRIVSNVLSVKSMRWGAAGSLALAIGIWGCGGGGGGGTATVASVRVGAGQSIGVNQTKYLVATALDANGNTISKGASSFQWQVVTGDQFIDFQSDRRAVGVAEGAPTVTASIDGIVSPAQVVTVVPTSAGCTSTSYAPNYYDAILTQGTPNVSGNFRYWTKTPLKIRFIRDSNWTQNLENIFMQGIAQWQAATGNGIDIEVTDNSSEDDIEIRYLPADELPGSAIGVTYATYDSETLEMASARIDIANDLESNGASLTTSSHELGHALGIGGHSPNDTDLMYFQENGTTTTTARDLNTLKTVYCNVFPRPSVRSATRNLVTERIFCLGHKHK